MNEEKNICNNEQILSISLVPVQSRHDEFLLQVFKESRIDLAYINGISEEQKSMIILQQYKIEQEQLKQMYPNAKFNIVMMNEKTVGRLYIHNGEISDRILQIGLLEEYRGMGIGKMLVKLVIEDAMKRGKNVQLQVAWFNEAAYRFYEKLGFKIIENNGVAYEMQYMP